MLEVERSTVTDRDELSHAVIDLEYPSSGQGFAFGGASHALRFLETGSHSASIEDPKESAVQSDRIKELTDELASIRATLTGRISEARAEGEQIGRAAAEQELHALQGRVVLFEECAKAANEERLAAIEASAVELSIRIAERVLRHEASLNPLFIAGAVRLAVERLRQNERGILRVPLSDVEPWRDFLQRSIKRPIEVQGDKDLSTGDVTLNTSAGQVDLSISAQLDEISRSFNQVLQATAGNG